MSDSSFVFVIKIFRFLLFLITWKVLELWYSSTWLLVVDTKYAKTKWSRPRACRLHLCYYDSLASALLSSCVWNSLVLKHTTTLFSLSDHYIPSWEWRVIVEQAQIKYHGRPMLFKSVNCDRARDYDGSSSWSVVF